MSDLASEFCAVWQDLAPFVEFATGFDVAVQQNLLGNLERFSPQRMRVDSIQAARDLDQGKPIDRRAKALLRYMHSRAGKQLRRVAGSDAYKGGVKAFDCHLCRMFGLERAAQAKKTALGFLGGCSGLPTSTSQMKLLLIFLPLLAHVLFGRVVRRAPVVTTALAAAASLAITLIVVMQSPVW